jgi:hypothetical protein
MSRAPGETRRANILARARRQARSSFGRNTMASPVRIAAVGAGLIGQAHIRRIREEPQAEFSAIVDPSPNEGPRTGADNNADLETWLVRGQRDGAVIQPNQLHVAARTRLHRGPRADPYRKANRGRRCEREGACRGLGKGGRSASRQASPLSKFDGVEAVEERGAWGELGSARRAQPSTRSKVAASAPGSIRSAGSSRTITLSR